MRKADEMVGGSKIAYPPVYIARTGPAFLLRPSTILFSTISTILSLARALTPIHHETCVFRSSLPRL